MLEGAVMWRVMTEAISRSLGYTALSCVALMLALQAIIFAIWGNDGDPPTAVVVIASALFWAAAVVLVTVAVLAIRRRQGSPPS